MKKNAAMMAAANELAKPPGPVLILFSLLIAFTLGFLASPLRSSSPPAPAPQQELEQCAPVASEAKTIVAHGDGFVSELRKLPDDLIRFQMSCRTPQLLDPVAARAAAIDALFDGVSPFHAFPPRHIARMVRTQKIKGWGSTHAVFERLIREVRPRIVVELGTFLGASAIHMAKLIRDQLVEEEDAKNPNPRSEGFTIFCLDDFRGWPGFRSAFPDIKQEHGNVMLYNQFLQNVAISNASDSVLPLPFSTSGGLYKLCELGIAADLIEVDAGHDFHSAWADINLGWSLMRDDGNSVMFGHDYFNGNDYHGVQRAVDLFASLKGLRVETDGQHWIYRTHT